MVFSSSIFIFLYLPVVLGGYFILKNNKHRNYWLLTMSLIFFSWNQLDYLWLILVSISINFFCGLQVSNSNVKRYRRLWLCIAILLNIGGLFYFKYFNFMCSIIGRIIQWEFNFSEVILPIGISFFTFQGLSYVIDVYMEKAKTQKNIFSLGLYIALFPQLIAGPIVRYIDIADEIDDRKITMDDFRQGISRFIIGLFKKAVIANTMAVTADSIWNLPLQENTVATAWLGLLTYSLQIFFDFSGYSDMAIGLGRMFGFHFLENFNYPYISKSITEFWRRWHISLSSWFRDYIYIPLGGNRKRVYINTAAVFFLTGFWHGAAIKFIFWGCWHGVFSLSEKKLRKLISSRNLAIHGGGGYLEFCPMFIPLV